MRVKGKFVFIFSLLVLFFFGQTQMAVFAEETTALKVDISTDKQSYKAGDEINYKLVINNASGNNAKNVVITSTLPEGLEVTKSEAEVKGNQLQWKVESIAASKEVSFAFTAKAKKSGTTAPSTDTNTGKDVTTGSSPKTGDETNFALYIMLLLGSIAVLSVALVVLNKKRLKKAATLLLAGSLLIPSLSTTKAEELTEKVTKTHKITLDDKVYEMTTTVEAVIEPVEEVGDFVIDITSPNEEVFKSDSDTITVEGNYKGKKGSVLKYSVFLNGSLEQDQNGDVEGDKNWKITNLKLKQGSNRVIVAAQDESGNIISDEVTITFKDDEDNDGLSFVLETTLKTDPTKADTDGDKLPDGVEYGIGTSPLLQDTNENGVLDSDEDPDQDNLTNLQELAAKTNPILDDSDQDGLKDGDEVATHKTSPVLEDTDGDTLADGDEIAMGLNPLAKDSDGDGILDADETITQELNEDLFEDINVEGNVTPVDISITGKENYNNAVTVLNAGNDAILSSIPGVVGTPIDIQSDASFENATISFKLDDSLLAKSSLEDYKVIWFDDVENKVKPLETTYDAENNKISATTNHFSYYMVIDSAAFYRGTDGENTSDKIEKGKADVTFVIDSTGSMGGTIDNVKSNITDFVNRLSTNKVDVRLGLIDYKDIEADGPETTRNLGWFESPDEFKTAMNGIYADGGGDDPESSVDALEEARIMGFAPNKAKFIVLLTDVDYHENTRFEGLNSMAEEIRRLKADNISVSTIIPTYYDYAYRELYTETGGIMADIYGNFSTELDKLIANIGEETNDKVTIRLSTNELVRLDKYPDNADKVTDTDGDKVPDSEELLEKTVCDNGRGRAVECWNFNSNPAKENTDYDIYKDDVDLDPKKEYVPSVVFLHGWTANQKNTFKVSTKMDGKNNSADATSSAAIEKYTNIENQAVTKAGSGLYGAVKSKVGKHSKLFTFSYPNLAHPDESAALLDKYIDNLAKAGKIKKPTATEKPKVIFVVHSMGGLVSRYYNEKISDKSADVDGIITVATPHWGGNGLADYCGEYPGDCGALEFFSGKSYDQVNSPAAKDLDPNRHIQKWSLFRGLYFERVESWTEGLNKGFTESTKNGASYFAVGGVYSTVWKPNIGEAPVQVRYLETNTSPDKGDYIALAKDRVKDADTWETIEPSNYDDVVVTLNSAFGSAHDVDDSDFHTKNHVLNFDKRYAIIGAKGDAHHSALPNNPHTEDAINYWIVNDLFKSYIADEYKNVIFFYVTEPNETN